MIHIRPVKTSESSLLQELNNEVFIDNAKYDPDIIVDWAFSEQGKEYFSELVKDSKSVCFVAENEAGRLVGYIAGEPKEYSYRMSTYFELDNMGVHPEFRSQGIGEQLIKYFNEEVKKRGFQKIYVNAYSKNAGAIRFYEKCGFEMIDVGLEATL